MRIMNALVAILMTSYFSPDAGLRATNWFKLLHIICPKVWFKVGRHKSSWNSHGTIFCAHSTLTNSATTRTVKLHHNWFFDMVIYFLVSVISWTFSSSSYERLRHLIASYLGPSRTNPNIMSDQVHYLQCLQYITVWFIIKSYFLKNFVINIFLWPSYFFCRVKNDGSSRFPPPSHFEETFVLNAPLNHLVMSCLVNMDRQSEKKFYG